MAEMIAQSGLMGSRGWSYMAIPLAWVLVVSPRLYAALMTSRAGGQIDNVNPRTASERLPEGVDRARIDRAVAAQSNGMENFPVFGLGILCANQAGVSPTYVNTVTIIWLVCRVLYNFIYINQRNEVVAGARSVVFHIANFSVLSLFIKAGLAVK